MGVYNHFDSKNGIIEALFIRGFERLRDALAGIAEIQDPYQALREGGRRYRALALAHPKVYELMFLRTMPGFEPSDHALEVAGGAFGALVAAVERAMGAGVIAEGDPTETAQVIWSNVHGWVSLELLGLVGDQPGTFELSCVTVLAGLRPDPRRPLPAGSVPPP
jgi:AcrR family transcriptional regulator